MEKEFISLMLNVMNFKDYIECAPICFVLTDFPSLQWRSGSAVCVVAASAGYPDHYEKGQGIAGNRAAHGAA